MTIDTEPATTDTLTAMLALRALLRQYDVERFYYHEAALLDAHHYQEWLALFTDDIHYFVPIRRTKSQRELADEFTKPGEMAFYVLVEPGHAVDRLLLPSDPAIATFDPDLLDAPRTLRRQPDRGCRVAPSPRPRRQSYAPTGAAPAGTRQGWRPSTARPTQPPPRP